MKYLVYAALALATGSAMAGPLHEAAAKGDVASLSSLLLSEDIKIGRAHV